MTPTRDIPGVKFTWSDTVPLGPTGLLQSKVTLPSLGVIANWPNTQKQTQRGSQNWETKKHATNERTEKICRKRI